MKLNIAKPPPFFVTVRSFRNYDPTSFALDMAQHSGYLSALQDHLPDDNEHLNSFNRVFEFVLDKHAPVKNIKIKSLSTPFVDGEIKSAMRNRDQLHHDYYHNRDLACRLVEL